MEQRAFTLAEIAAMGGPKHSKAYELIASGELRASSLPTIRYTWRPYPRWSRRPPRRRASARMGSAMGNLGEGEEGS
jgi:hypothetical protein